MDTGVLKRVASFDFALISDGIPIGSPLGRNQVVRRLRLEVAAFGLEARLGAFAVAVAALDLALLAAAAFFGAAFLAADFPFPAGLRRIWS